MQNLSNIGVIKDILNRHGFSFSKGLGQNFLINPSVCPRMAVLGGAQPGWGVIEIGAGVGVLTAELARRADKVASVELDRSLLPILKETLADCPNAEIVPGDILKTDIPALVEEKFAGLKAVACANLPYNITTPAITALIEAGCFQSITVMIQREVARRICAKPGTGDYGAFSVFCQYHTAPELLFDVPPECFIPAPKVTSSVLRMVPRSAPEEGDDPEHFFRVGRAAFAQRRKTLVNGLHAAFGDRLTKEQLAGILVDCGLPADVRGERLGIPEFAGISRKIRQTQG